MEQLLGNAGLFSRIDPQRGLDHGAWVPLMMAWPDADIPVVQLSVQTHLGPVHHLAMGRALAPLQDEGVLIIGSGSYTHNLSNLRKPGQADYPDWVLAFGDWFEAALKEGHTDDLLDYRTLAPKPRTTTRPKSICCLCSLRWAQPGRTGAPGTCTKA